MLGRWEVCSKANDFAEEPRLDGEALVNEISRMELRCGGYKIHCTVLTEFCWFGLYVFILV